MDSSGQSKDQHASLFQLLFEQSREAVILAKADKGFPILKANKRTEQLLGEATEELIGLKLVELWSEEQCHELLNRLQEAHPDGSSGSYLGKLSRRDGLSFTAELTYSLSQSGDDSILLISFEDISEKIQAQEDIELRNIAIANVTSGVTVADARQPDLPLIYVNRGFLEMTGYSAKEAIGRSCRFLQGEDRQQPELDLLRKSLREGSPCKVRLKNYKKDGTLFFNELHISPVHNDMGELTHFVGIQIDVTEQVKARKSLEYSEALHRKALEQERELNEFKSRFISMVSHEFRTPMTGIQASAALLRKFGDKLSHEKQQQHLSNIEISLKRMNRLLDNVLFFSKAESNKLKVNPRPVELEKHLADFIESFAMAYPGREIQQDCQLPSETIQHIDEHLLDHILQNLLGNALKYSSPEKPVTCVLRENGDRIEVAVTDHGIGIPEADQKRLFEAFHRANNVGTRQGTGLGLNIVQRAVELLDGEFSFSSKEDEGSTFLVSIPKRQSMKEDK